MRLMHAGFCLLMVLGLTSVVAAEDRPNFIVFVADDMAWDDCGTYGHPSIRTPHIDKLAREGMQFNNAFLTCSSCSPSRSSILTGRYPHSTGAPQLHQPLPSDQVTIFQLLKAGGYYTAAAGKWHLGKAEEKQLSRFHAGRKTSWIEAIKARPLDQPCFLWLAFSDPHRPYQANTIPQPHRPEDVVVPPYLPDVPETRRDLALYYDEIARLDGVVGDVLEVLEKQGAADDTVVVFLSDNGRPFPRGKTTIFDSGVKTPWIVRWPKGIRPATTTQSIISSVDLAPTVLELAGVKGGETFQGKSFVPILDDPSAEIRKYAFSEHNWHDFDDHGRSVRSARYRYIENSYTDIPLTPPADAVRGETYQAMLKLRAAGKLTDIQQQCFTIPRQAEELYDLQTDPDELKNLAADPKFAAVRDRLRGELNAWKQRTDDRVPEKRRPDEFDRVTGKRLK